MLKDFKISPIMKQGYGGNRVLFCNYLAPSSQRSAFRRSVECHKGEDMMDESPTAYKSIDAVMGAQRDLVEIVHTCAR
jgi:hypothetical protein